MGLNWTDTVVVQVTKSLNLPQKLKGRVILPADRTSTTWELCAGSCKEQTITMGLDVG